MEQERIAARHVLTESGWTAEEIEILLPVSYTHLDVYKRQALLLACWWLRRTVAELRTELPAAQTVFGVFDQKPQLMTFMASVSIVTGTPSDATAYAESFGALLKVWSVTELRLALQLPPVVAAKDAVVGRFGVAGGQDTEPVLAHLITLGYSRDEALRALAGKA